MHHPETSFENGRGVGDKPRSVQPSESQDPGEWENMIRSSPLARALDDRSKKFEDEVLGTLPPKPQNPKPNELWV